MHNFDVLEFVVIIDVSKEVMFLKDMVVSLESSGQKQLAIEPCIYKLVEYTHSICRIDINCITEKLTCSRHDITEKLLSWR
jgi:hypothetical protein